MKRRTAIGLALLSILAAGRAFAEEAKKDEASLTKVSDLYPNDMGSAEIDVSAYPKEHRAAYRTFAFKCAACHTIARPINSQFLELTADELAKAKTDDPELFKDAKITFAEEMIWNRYVKRMMTKAGCPVKKEDGRPIWEFLVYDSKVRKMGENGKEFRKMRAKLLSEFKEHHPDGYARLFTTAK
jgi:hypothetical protein